MKRFFIIVLILFSFLMLNQLSFADTAMDAFTDDSASPTLTGSYFIGYRGTTAYRWTISSIFGLKIGTLTNTYLCTTDGTKINCTTAPTTYQTALTNPLVAGTMNTGYYCIKNAASNTLDCNTQYTTASNFIFGSDARGDIAVRGASAYGRLAKGGAAYTFLRMNSGNTDPEWSTATIDDSTSNVTKICNGTSCLKVKAGQLIYFDGTFTDGYLCTYTASGTLIGCNTNPATYLPASRFSFAGANNVTTYTGNFSVGFTFTGNTGVTFPTSGTIATTAQLPTQASLNVDDIQTALGIADGAVNFGTFTGSTIADNQTGKAAMQALETAVELRMLISSAATDNSTATHLLCKDNSGEIENCTLVGVAISGTTAPTITVTPQEVDGHTDATNLTASQMTSSIIYNTGQAASDVTLNLPTAAASLNALFTVGTAQTNKWRVRAGANDKIYLIAAAGTIAAGSDNGYVGFVNAQVGQSFACWTFKTDAYDWMCKAIAIGTSTFVAE